MLLETARADKSVVAVTSKVKGSGTLDGFEKALPEQFIKMSTAEQNVVGVAAGLARCGTKLFACGPARFSSARAIEQDRDVRNSTHERNIVQRVVGAAVPCPPDGGDNPLRAFFDIVLPMSTVGIVTVITLVFLQTSNDLLLALVMIVSASLKTLNLAVFLLRG